MTGLAVGAGGSCAVCGALEPFDLAICPACAAAAPEADALVFVARSGDQSARAHVEAVVAAALGPAAPPSAVRAGAAGVATIARAPARIAERIVERLADQGVAAGLVPAARALTRVPVALVALVLVAAAVGAVAGMASVPELLWLSPVMAVGVLGTAAHLARRPLWQRRSADAPLADDAAALARRALAGLPEGEARRLLAELLRHVRAAVAQERAGPIIDAACAAAGTLSRLEEDVAILDQATGSEPASAARHQVRGRAERARAGLAARLRDTVTAIARLRVESRIGPAAADARALESLTRELELEARHYEEAVTEVAALLRELPA